MHLKALRLRGFKSFPGSVELRFDRGIAVVVGPNGSGKSNIADALQWAMAVSSPVQLRAPTGQDVLFSGSDSRPPAGVCEVELVLDNECNTLPLEFGEVSVMRRMYRDGESEYLVNRARVRRLDVLELLSDTGLGREMHSVIGQGRVEEILLSKPHERRRFVEEAAGLGKYQRRRSRAESKLARVAAELERAADLEREVKARLRPLAMQATAAERAAKLAGEIASGRMLLLASDAVAEEREAAAARGRLGEAAAARDTSDVGLAGLAARRTTAEAELSGLAAAQERAGHTFYAFETARERAEMAAGRLEGVRAAVARATARRRAAGERAAAEAASLGRRAEEAARAAAELGAAGPRPDEGAAEEAADAAAAAEAALAASLEARRALAEAQGQAATTRREAETARRRATDLAAQAEALGAASAGRAEAAAAVAAEAESAKAAAAAAAEALAHAGETLTAARAEADATAAAERAAAAELAEAASEADLARTRLAALEGAVERGEGLTPAARALKAAGAELVASGVEAQPGYERAVAAALGWRAGAVVAERLDEALELLGRAGGDVAVVLRAAPALGSTLPPAPDARPLSEVVNIRDGAAARLIEGVWLVPDLAPVAHGIAVTAEGTGIDADRGELWRAADAGEAAWMAARAERDRVAAAVDGGERAVQAARERAGAATAAAATAASAHAAAATAAEAARTAHDAAAAAARDAVQRRDRLSDELARDDAARDIALHDLEAERRRLAELDAVAAGLERGLEERRAEAEAADTRHAQAEQRRRTAAEAAARRLAELAAARERAERHALDAARDRAAADAATTSAATAAALAATAEGLLTAAGAIGAAAAAAIGRSEALRAPARAGMARIEERATALAGELQTCATEEAAAQGRAREIAAAVTEAEVALARSAGRIDELGRRSAAIAAEFGLEAPALEEPLDADVAAATAARLERLERRRESLGAVNPLAAQEYEQARGRADELAEQCADLARSLRDVRTLIRDVTQTIDRRFAETFGEVAKRFSEVIGTLFPGGSGRLRLTDDVVAVAPAAAEDGEEEAPAERPEPGIELEVRPAGKRIEALSLLSGGEKALTAIAFLFALLLTKPSPFYLLDEVEAALDDANIERFLELLRTYQDRAQFIVVTHQRRTMEVADVLYGVTMAGDGESRVLSRRLPADGPRAVSA
jgi:chromosome segregation protein